MATPAKRVRAPTAESAVVENPAEGVFLVAARLDPLTSATSAAVLVGSGFTARNGKEDLFSAGAWPAVVAVDAELGMVTPWRTGPSCAFLASAASFSLMYFSNCLAYFSW